CLRQARQLAVAVVRARSGRECSLDELVSHGRGRVTRRVEAVRANRRTRDVVATAVELLLHCEQRNRAGKERIAAEFERQLIGGVRARSVELEHRTGAGAVEFERLFAAYGGPVRRRRDVDAPREHAPTTDL